MSGDHQKPYHFVIMAAQRAGVVNPLAEAAGVSHKCLVAIDGKSLIERTLSEIIASGLARRVSVSIEDDAPLKSDSYVRGLMDAGFVRFVKSTDNLFDSVAAALTADDDTPAIITTADNALFTGEMYRYFAQGAESFDASGAFCRKETLLSKYPEGQPRFHRFKNGEYTNCNTFAIMNPEAVSAAAMFRSGGQFLKSSPLRAIRTFGLINAIGYKNGWFTLEGAFQVLSRKFGVSVGVVDMPYPEAPIDVDNAKSLEMTSRIIAERKAAAEI